MALVMLDTGVSSRIIQDRLDGPLGARRTRQVWCVSFVTVGELWQWAAMRSHGSGMSGEPD